ncbi:MAG: sodium:solute symporter family protein [Venatoribacter sp.]
MSQFMINMLFVGASFVLYFSIAIWARAGSTKEYYVAGGGVHPVANGMATAADWMSAASFIGMAGLVGVGYINSSFLMGWTGGYVLLAMLLAPYLRKFGKFTVPTFIGERFYSRPARLIAVVCLIMASVTYVIGQMSGAGVAFSRFLEVSSDAGIWIAAIVVLFYAVLGGMKGITYTQVAQYVVLIVAYTIPAIFISAQLTGNPIPMFGMLGNHLESGQPLFVQLDQVLHELGFAGFTDHVDNIFNMFLFTMTLMIGTAGLPHVIIRFFTVPKVSDARWSAGWALVFIAALYLSAPAVGSMARLNLLHTVYPDGPTAEAVAHTQTPEWFQTWEETGLLKFTDKNGDGKIQYYNDSTAKGKEIAAERGWEGNELYVNPDIMVLANPEIAALPSWVIGLIAAGGIAAALSTAAGLLLAISSAVSHDIIKVFINPEISEKNELLAARVVMTVAIAISTWLGLNPPGFAAQTVALAFGIAAASIFPAIMMGIFSKRVNSKGAVAGMLTGLITQLLYIFTYLGWFFIPGTNMLANTPDNWLFGISPMSFGAVAALLHFIVAFAVSLASEDVPEEIKALVESVRSPHGAGTAVDH